jgi:hypothetical protein
MAGDCLGPWARLDAATVPVVASLGADAVQLVALGDGFRERGATHEPRAVADGLGVAIDVDGDHVVGSVGVDDAEPRKGGCREVVDGLDPGDVRTFKHEPVLSHPPTLGQAADSGLSAAGRLAAGALRP